MNRRYFLLAISTSGALLSLALFVGVVRGAASSAGYAAGALMQDRADTLPPSEEGPGVSQAEQLLSQPLATRADRLGQAGTEIFLPIIQNADPSGAGFPKERAALMAIFYSAEGESWSDNTGWGSEASYCTWAGVTCDSFLHVIGLDLRVRGGGLAAEIGDLTYLTKLSIYGEFLCWSKHCEYFGLTGEIPAEIGNLGQLQELFMGDNQFSSPLPPQIGNLENLRILFLVANSLLGPIPAEIDTLQNLEYINLSTNGFSGPLPSELGNLANLQELYLPLNQLSGEIPAEIGNLGNLHILDLEYNSLSGSIPPEMGNLVSLRELRLKYNQLSGSIPAQLGNLNNLQILDLGVNQLTGPIAAELGNLANLQTLELGWNQISGTIPVEIGNLANLQSLSLSDNQLSGIIPAFLSKLGNLITFTLYANPDLTCWETQEALDWALSLVYYEGPTCY